MAFTGFVFEENRVESICNALQKSKKTNQKNKKDALQNNNTNLGS